eukprot:gb/GECG01010395.1/.p1 GENE.gb/GECG01010395.1/~~gb/GECG01010395.1/.p1  ORF type:complete len:184 (+),score=11.18 gb/GECG01010395.1/:1-552(+)
MSHYGSTIVKNPPQIVYSAIRDEHDQLDSKIRLYTKVQLSSRWVREIERLEMEETEASEDDKLAKVLLDTIQADILYFDNGIPYVHTQDSVNGQTVVLRRLVDAPSVTFSFNRESGEVRQNLSLSTVYARLLTGKVDGPQVDAYVATRTLPISSAHSGSRSEPAFLRYLLYSVLHCLLQDHLK